MTFSPLHCLGTKPENELVYFFMFTKTILSLIFCRVFTIYTKVLPLDTACRVWDLFCRDGDSFLFRTALGKFTLLPRESKAETMHEHM